MLGKLLHTTARPVDDPAAVGVAALREELLAALTAHTERGLVDQITELERLKSAAAAQQARLTAELDERRRMVRAARELLGETRPHEPNPDAGLGRDIGLARRESPYDGRRKLGLARALLRDLPHTLAALEHGDLNERRAQIIATETSRPQP